MASGTSGAATPVDATSSTGAGMAGGTTASSADATMAPAAGSDASTAPKHAPGTNESHPRAEAVNKANGVK
jgi:hypothetical protein